MNQKAKFKAAIAFADAATGIHYSPGDPINPATLKPSKDVDDRTAELLAKGHIVDIDAAISTALPTDDGTTIDRFDVRDGESVEDARKRAGLAPVVSVNASKGAVAAQNAGKEGMPGPAQQDALNTEADGKKESGQ